MCMIVGYTSQICNSLKEIILVRYVVEITNPEKFGD